MRRSLRTLRPTSPMPFAVDQHAASGHRFLNRRPGASKLNHLAVFGHRTFSSAIPTLLGQTGVQDQVAVFAVDREKYLGLVRLIISLSSS